MYTQLRGKASTKAIDVSTVVTSNYCYKERTLQFERKKRPGLQEILNRVDENKSTTRKDRGR